MGDVGYGLVHVYTGRSTKHEPIAILGLDSVVAKHNSLLQAWNIANLLLSSCHGHVQPNSHLVSAHVPRHSSGIIARLHSSTSSDHLLSFILSLRVKHSSIHSFIQAFKHSLVLCPQPTIQSFLIVLHRPGNPRSTFCLETCSLCEDNLVDLSAKPALLMDGASWSSPRRSTSLTRRSLSCEFGAVLSETVSAPLTDNFPPRPFSGHAMLIHSLPVALGRISFQQNGPANLKHKTQTSQRLFLFVP